MAGPARDPIIRSSRIYFPWLPPDIAEEPGLLIGILQSARRYFGLKDSLVRAAGDPPRGSGLRLYVAYLDWQTRLGPKGSALQVRRSDSLSHRFVRRMLLDAVMEGYQAAGFAIDRRHAARVLRRELALGRDPDLVALVAFASGRPVAHATLRLSERDELTDAPYVELVDLSTLMIAEAAGSTQALLDAATLELGEGVTIRGSVTAEVESPSWRDLLERLVSAGWRPAYDLWLTC